MSARVTLRVGLRQGRLLREPQIRTSGSQPSRGAEFATTAHGPDLVLSARQAVRYLVDYLIAERELTSEEAYVLASVAADLRISEIVDAPNWIVSAFIPESIFGPRVESRARTAFGLDGRPARGPVARRRR